MYAPTIGLGRRAGFALSVGWPENVCSRATLRALMPEGESRQHGDGNRITKALAVTGLATARPCSARRAVRPQTGLEGAARQRGSLLRKFEVRDFLRPGAIGVIEEQLVRERNTAVALRRRAELDLQRALLL